MLRKTLLALSLLIPLTQNAVATDQSWDHGGVELDSTGKLSLFGTVSAKQVKEYLKPLEAGKVKEINILQCDNMTNGTLVQLSYFMPHVTKLSMRFNGRCTSDDLNALAKSSSSLKELSFAYVDILTNQTLNIFAKRNPGLTSLFLADCRAVTPGGLGAFAGPQSKLTHLHLANVLGRYAFASDEKVRAYQSRQWFGQLFSQGQIIYLKPVTEEDSKNDKTTHIPGTYAGNPPAFMSVTHLSLLDVSLSDPGLISVSAAFPSVIDLGLNNCSAITGSGLFGSQAHFPLLRKLSIYGCERFTFKPGFDLLLNANLQLDHLVLGGHPFKILEGMKPVAEYLDDLKHRRKDGRVYKKWARMDGFPTLKSLSLQHSDEMTDETMQLFAAWCPQLEHLKVLCCENVKAPEYTEWQFPAELDEEVARLDDEIIHLQGDFDKVKGTGKKRNQSRKRDHIGNLWLAAQEELNAAKTKRQKYKGSQKVLKAFPNLKLVTRKNVDPFPPAKSDGVN